MMPSDPASKAPFRRYHLLTKPATGGAPTNSMYFLNTNYIMYRPHRDRNMVPLDPDRFSVNQDAMVKLIGWAGNMTLSNARLQGVQRVVAGVERGPLGDRPRFQHPADFQTDIGVHPRGMMLLNNEDGVVRHR